MLQQRAPRSRQRDAARMPFEYRNADGRLQVFWRAPGGNIETTFQQTGGGRFSVVDFGGNLAAF